MVSWSTFFLLIGYTSLYFVFRFIGYRGVFYIGFMILLISFFIEFYLLVDLWVSGSIKHNSYFFWGGFSTNNLIVFDSISDIFTKTISFVLLSGSLLVYYFSYYDIWDESYGSEFLITLGLFISFMYILINSGNLIVFYLGWEGIGITSLFLVNFWGNRIRAVKASFKIFTINKLGDFFIIILIISLITLLGDINFFTISSTLTLFYSKSIAILDGYPYLLEFLSIVLVLSGVVKSAQLGFHIWLLEAMEAPLGASALMHSSTLVAAGLILITKLYIIIDISLIGRLLLFAFGILSAVIASFIACFQYELKSVMAYSTISNMGYMFVLLSLGAFKEMLLIFIFHAYIKIFIFLTVGGILIHCNGCQDIRWMGGLLAYMPLHWGSFFVCSLCLIGLPFWTGYLCKNFILSAICNYTLILRGGWFLILVSFFFSFFYVSRVLFFIFFQVKMVIDLYID